jgi:hypothetical protein
MAHDVVVDSETTNSGEHFTVRVGYQGFDQSALLLVYKEYREQEEGDVTYAEVLYQYNGSNPEPALRSVDLYAIVTERIKNGDSTISVLRYIREQTHWDLDAAKKFYQSAFLSSNLG